MFKVISVNMNISLLFRLHLLLHQRGLDDAPLFDALNLLALQLQEVHHFPLFSGLAWELLEQDCPLVSQVDPVGLFCVLPHGETLLGGMFDQGLYLLGEERVAHIPEI